MLKSSNTTAENLNFQKKPKQISCFYKIYFLFFKKIILAKHRLNIHNQLCIAVRETPPCATSI